MIVVVMLLIKLQGSFVLHEMYVLLFPDDSDVDTFYDALLVLMFLTPCNFTNIYREF